MKNNLIIASVFIIWAGGKIQAQDPAFSQFFANRLFFNPSWAGVGNEDRRFFLNYRNQWPGIEKAFVTYSASYDQYVEPAHGGIGFRIMNDLQGGSDLSQLSISGIYSYHLQVNRRLTINAGFEAGYVQRQIKASEFVFEDNSESYGNDKHDFPDFSVGLSAFSGNYYAGLSVAHILQPSLSDNPTSLTRLPMRIIAYAGGLIPVNDRKFGKEVVQLSPNLIYYQQGKFNQLNYGIEGLLNEQFLAGLWLRQNFGVKFSSLIFSFGYVTKNFSLRYSYDRQLSSPAVHLPIMGAHEISLIVTPSGEQKKKHRAIKCPKI